jgi:cell division protease FtsH
LTKNILLWLVIAMVLMSVFNNFTNPNGNSSNEIDYSTFLAEVRQGRVSAVEIDDEIIRGVTHTGESFVTYAPNDPKLVDDLVSNQVDIKAKKEEETSLLVHLLISSFPILLLIGVWIFFMKQMQGGGRGGALSFGKSKARMLTEDKNHITFEDVAGVDEAKEEVEELVEFLKDPSRFRKLGGRIPRGVLMTGSPGTGKTLLAKAIAGEAKVPFFTISGSDFVEMFVGVGASRVRDMFDQAKKNAPCIIFIDEIDAVGRQRGAGLGGGHDEREQTLNQLLVEMDGFDASEGVIVIAATNRPDVLDPALLRPGRFDRQVTVPLPDIRGREAILEVHMKKVPLDKDIDTEIIARGTPGFSGADLANLINEAALFAARENKKVVSMEQFEQLPVEDRYSHNREYLLARIAVLMGGRIAEEVFMNQMTTGASNDFEQATQLSQNMVSRWGMSDALGPRVYGDNQSEVFLGREMSTHRNVSPDTAEKVENEVSRIIDQEYARAREIIEDNSEKIEVMAKALLEWETLDSDQVDQIMAGEEPTPPADLSSKDKKPKGGASAKPAETDDTPTLDESDLDLPDPTKLN